MLLRYYNAIIKNIKLTQDVQKQRFQSIIKYLESTKSKTVKSDKLFYELTVDF